MRLADARRWIVLLPFALTACASIVGDFAFVGSSSSSGTSTSSSSGGVGGTAATSSTTSTTSGSSSSGMTVDCLALATTRCTQMKACAPYVYQATYGSTSPANDMLCASEAARICALPPLFDNTNPGVTDPVACQAALAGDCADYLVAIDEPPASCLSAPGNLKTNEGCVDPSQCVVGDTCWDGGPSSCPSYCGPELGAGVRCGYQGIEGTPGPNTNCDYRNGATCATDPTGGEYFLCTKVPRNGVGETCVANGCRSGLACKDAIGQPSTCVALLAEGATCDPNALGYMVDPCDYRLGLVCLPDLGASTSSCKPNDIVPVGSACGSVTDAGPEGGTVSYTQVCDAYSFCSSANVCTPKSKLGEPCTDASVCYPGYACTAATCQIPVVPVDPACTPELTVPITSLECGGTPGGLPLDCGAPDAGGVCCTDPNNSVGTATVSTSCSCTGGSRFTCTDSAECGSGEVCCVSYPMGLALEASCVSGSACSGVDWEICRMDNPNACGSTGSGCKSAVAASTFPDFLPTNVGFCSSEAVKPVSQGGCGGPTASCTATNADTACCSQRCSQYFGCD